MKKIARINTSIRISELVVALERLLSWLEKHFPEGDSYLSEKKEELEKISKRITAAFKKDKAYSSHEEKDSVRDNLVKLFFKLLDGYTAHPDEKISSSAKALYDKFYKKYSSITRANYDEESGLLSSMFGDLDATDVQASIALLDGVATRVEQLKSAQADFEATHKAYLEAKKESESEVSATSYKKSVLFLVNDEILPYLATMRRVSASKYEELASMFDREIQAVNDKVAARSKAAKDSADKAE